MSNGCICCTLREDLLVEVEKLAKDGKFDYLLIESTGISEPLPVAETFTFEGEDGKSLSEIAQIDTMVTVVDAFNFLRDYSSQDFLKHRGEVMGEDDQRTVVDLINEQIEFCDVIVLNKADLVSAKDFDKLKAILNTLNPRAKIVPAQFGKVALNEVLGTGLFDFDAAEQAPGWLKELRGEHIPETEEYGISSFVYRARRPFHPERFKKLIDTEWAGVLRSKGMFWLASRFDYAGNWSQAGAVCRNEKAGKWWAAVPKNNWPESKEWQDNIKKYFAGQYGDRRQEIVLIGIDMDKDKITKMFDDCLLTNKEMRLGKIRWKQFIDPFPRWESAKEAA